MYKQFFGFRERPFRLVPNPAYLYLSNSHEEALGHLNYAVSQGEGFVEITGEVGTGKTTLCRMFLENLDERTEAAFIFNPKLDAIGLLKEINHEFEIPSDGTAPRDLIETLNSFLMEKTKEGKHVILLIDEAQNLAEDVLEQLRLLSNLETTTRKLIQIILVGQPELGDMLDSHELRQLSQRITLRCHLKPLTFKETKEYIRHRIRIASHKPAAHFTGEAFRLIYRYSSGIPRLINIICDRALLTAFTLDRYKLTGKIIRSSIRELEGGRQEKIAGRFSRSKFAALMASLVCIFLLVLFFQPILIEKMKAPESDKAASAAVSKRTDTEQGDKRHENHQTDMLTDLDVQKPARNTPVEVDAGGGDEGLKETPETLVIRDVRLADIMQNMSTVSSRAMAFTHALRRWEEAGGVSHYLESMDDDNEFFRLAAKQRGFMCNRIEGDVTVLRKHNLPAILELYYPGALSPKFMTIVSLDDDSVSLQKDDRTILMVPIEEMMMAWNGSAYVIWKNFFNYTGVIPLNASRDSIITLKIHLRKIGFEGVAVSPFYDESTSAAVREIQKRNGLRIDGIVGPMTMIAMYNEDPSLNIPHLLKTVLNVQESAEEQLR